MTNLKERYGVIVIGAGVGGLTCGAFLAKEGLSVLVTEQHSKPGGYCTSFRRKGFTFDAGTDLVVGAERGGWMHNILEELGLKDEIEFVELAPFTRIIGSDYDIPSTPLKGLGIGWYEATRYWQHHQGLVVESTKPLPGGLRCRELVAQYPTKRVS